MPVTGRKPKPQGQAVHRNPPAHDWTEIPDVPFRSGPKLPPRRANGRPWEARTRETWKAWSTMPHCVLWKPSDWAFALDSIELAAAFRETGEPKYAIELRNRERVLGTTVDFRRDLRIRYVDPEKKLDTPAGVTNIADYRDL